jgi:hypothetical protein
MTLTDVTSRSVENSLVGARRMGAGCRRRRPSSGWGPSLGLVSICALLASMGAAAVRSPDALAGSLHVYGCQTPSSRPAPIDGWSGSVVGSYVYAVDGCPNRGLEAQIGGNVAQPANSTSATWTFSAPAGTTISAARLLVAGSNRGVLAPGQAAETVFDWTAPNNAYDSSDVFSQCQEANCGKMGGTFLNVPQAFLQDTTHIYMTAFCGSGYAGQSCPATGGGDPMVRAQLVRSDITLFQTSQPTVSNVSGSLLAPGVLHGSQNILFTAYDQASGIYQGIFEIDGHTVSSQVINSNSGRCQNVGGTTDGTYAFLYVQPCPQQVTADLSLDTAQIADGTHRLKVLVQNAAGDIAVAADTTITVENRGLQSGHSNSPENNSHSGGGVLAPGACNGTGCDDQAQIVLDSRRRVITHTYRGSAVKLAGRLLNRTGAPIAGAQLDLLQEPAATGYSPRLIATATTASDGSWTLTASRGPSRLLQVAYRSHVGDPTYAAHMDLSERVQAPVALYARRHVNPSVPVLFHGRLGGGYIPQGGALVSLEILYGGRWRTFATARAGMTGVFRYRYIFSAGYGPTTYHFRASVLSTSDYPFLGGHSPSVRVGVA